MVTPSAPGTTALPVRLAVFDFDRTLSCGHVYAALAGNGDSILPVPPPHARTERGQLSRIAELDGLAEFRARGGFAFAAFAGPDRVSHLRAVLDDLRVAGVECVICSRGLVGPIRRCLEQVGLLGFFSQVFGAIGSDGPGGNNPTPYDLRLPPGAPGPALSRLLGGRECAGWGGKGQLIQRCLRERGLQGENAVFIDDDPAEIASVLGVCQTLQVQPATPGGPAQGMGAREFTHLRRLAACAAGAAGPGRAAKQSASPPRAALDTSLNDSGSRSARTSSMESSPNSLLDAFTAIAGDRGGRQGQPCLGAGQQQPRRSTSVPAQLQPARRQLPPQSQLQPYQQSQLPSSRDQQPQSYPPQLPEPQSFPQQLNDLLRGPGNGMHFPFFRMDECDEEAADAGQRGSTMPEGARYGLGGRSTPSMPAWERGPRSSSLPHEAPRSASAPSAPGPRQQGDSWHEQRPSGATGHGPELYKGHGVPPPPPPPPRPLDYGMQEDRGRPGCGAREGGRSPPAWAPADGGLPEPAAERPADWEEWADPRCPASAEAEHPTRAARASVPDPWQQGPFDEPARPPNGERHGPPRRRMSRHRDQREYAGGPTEVEVQDDQVQACCQLFPATGGQAQAAKGSTAKGASGCMMQ